jgi:hypothetical protein
VGRKLGIDPQIAQAAAEQNGNITRPQLLGLGLSGWAIKHRVNQGRLFPVYRGVYAVGRPPSTPIEKASAAVLACGDRAALSHGSAMVLWGFWRHWYEPFEVSVAVDRRPRGIRTHRVTGLLHRDVTIRHGIRVTSPARTLLDGAPRVRARSLIRYINDARRAGLVTLEALADVVNRFPRHPGAPLLARHAQTKQNPTRSPLEDDFLPFCERHGLPEPVVNTVLHGYEVDALFAEELVVVELDGWPFHNGRDAFEADRDRDAALLERGIPTVRITRRRLRRTPEREAARLHAILADWRGRRAAALPGATRRERRAI